MRSISIRLELLGVTLCPVVEYNVLSNPIVLFKRRSWLDSMVTVSIEVKLT